MNHSAFSLLVVLTAGTSSLLADDWPQWGGPQRDGVWREQGIAKSLPAELHYKWRTPIGAGYAGPAVAEGRVFVTDRQLGKGEKNPDNPFARENVRGTERVLCLDAESGDEIWKHEYPCAYEVSYPAGPRATPTVADGVVYALGAMGDLHALDAKTGDVKWAKHYVRDYGTTINTWGMSAAPLVDGERLILLVGGTENRLVVALDRRTGKLLWNALEETDPGYAPPVIVEAGGKRQLIIWTPENVHSLDPATGEHFWTQAFKCNSGLSVTMPVFDPERRRLFVTTFYNGPLMLELSANTPAAKVLWRGKSKSEQKTDGLHAIMCTPILASETIYGVCSYGQLRGLKAGTGERLWETRAATGEGRWWNAFLVRHENRVLIANEQGELIVARLTPAGYQEISRSKLIEPTRKVRRRMTVWSHPAFARKSVFARNDNEIVCADLSAAAQGETAGQ